MAPRKRLLKNRSLPANLYVLRKNGAEYYSYRHPITKMIHSLGTDKKKAIASARQLNMILVKEDDLTRKVLGNSGHTLSALIDRYREEMLPRKNLSNSTLQLYEYRLNRFIEDLGSKPLEYFTTQTVAEYLDSTFKGNAYVKHRGTLVDLFRFGMTKGWLDDNPAETTFAKSEDKKKRQRMTMEQFKAIHSKAPGWLKNAMELALVTLQGRYEICNMKFEDIQDGYLYITREKTKKNEWSNIRIQVTSDITAVVKRARKSGIVSPFIIHREPERRNRAKGREHWTQLTLNDFSARFREIRDEIKLFESIPKEQRPTFHEIRALGSWLYEKAGHETTYVQRLMAHADEKMTEYYQSGHEKKWLEARAELSLKQLLSDTV